LQAITTLPPRDQTAVGVKVTLIEHDDPAATEVPHVFVWEKSSEAPMLLIFRFAVPVLVRVMDFGELLVPIKVSPKLRLDPPPLGNVLGESVTAGAVPTPVKLTVCGLPGALSNTSKTFDRVPGCVGVKVTLIVQLAPAGRECVQVWV